MTPQSIEQRIAERLKRSPEARNDAEEIIRAELREVREVISVLVDEAGFNSARLRNAGYPDRADELKAAATRLRAVMGE